MKVTTLETLSSVSETSMPNAAEDLAALVSGEQRAVVLMVDLEDARASERYSLEEASDHIYTGVRSVADLFDASSYGQLSLSGDADGDGWVDAFDPFEIAYSASACDPHGWATAADEAAETAGVDLSLYRYRVYLLPHWSALNCDWAGLGNVGCGSWCRSWIAEAESPMVIAHELGHNFGMLHASTDPNNDGIVDVEYGDYSDPMGLSRAWHVFNAPHTDQMGWFDAFPGTIATAPYWDDLNPSAGGAVYSLLEGEAPRRRLTVAWVDVPYYDGTGTVTFEATLNEQQGRIQFRYLDVESGALGDSGGPPRSASRTRWGC